MSSTLVIVLCVLVFPLLVGADWLFCKVWDWFERRARLRVTGRAAREPWDELSDDERAALRRWHRN